MEQIKEAVYLINDERYLHLRENGTGVGFATYNKVTGEPLESGQISEKNLPPDGQNTIPAARNWYLFELSDDDRKVIQQESVKILENIPQAGIGRRRIWEPETLPKDIRLINSHYDDLYRIPDGGVIQVDYPDGRSFTARVEHLDDYHFDMGGLGNVFHICQFAEVMERNHADFYPEIQTQDEQAAWELGGKGYLAIQSYEDGLTHSIALGKNAQPTPERCRSERVWDFPTSILQRKICICAHECTACISCVPYTARSFVLFAENGCDRCTGSHYAPEHCVLSERFCL